MAGGQDETASENTPLLPGAQRVQREFEDALHEEDPDATLFSVLVKRPGAVIVALSLFVLLILATTSVSGLTSPEFVGRAAEVPQLVPVSAELQHISNNEISTTGIIDVRMDYDVLGDGYVSTLLRRAATKLATITVRFDDAIDIRATRDGDTWEHVISMRVDGTHNVSITPDAEFEMKLETRMFDIGRASIVGMIVGRALANEPVTLKAEGTVVASRWGLEWRAPFSIVRTVTLPQQTTDELADISSVHVGAAAVHGVNVTAMVNATLGPFPVSGRVPAMGWLVKIPGCEPGRLEVLCEGFNPPFEIASGDAEVEAWFSSLITRIPPHLTAPCDPKDENAKSAVDRWISAYLAGELSTFYIEGSGQCDSEILNELFTGFDIPVSVFGKPASEKLISSVTIENVNFEGQNPLAAADEMQFSGKALVGVTLPRFLAIDKSTVVMVDGVRGSIQLFTEGGEHFAQVLASEWLQTITLANRSGYKITCYFDRIPMRVTNTQAFARVSEELLFRGHAPVRYDAVVDVLMDTPVGDFSVKKVRVKGATEMRT